MQIFHNTCRNRVGSNKGVAKHDFVVVHLFCLQIRIQRILIRIPVNCMHTLLQFMLSQRQYQLLVQIPTRPVLFSSIRCGRISCINAECGSLFRTVDL